MARQVRQPALFLPMRVWDLPTRLFHWLLVLLVPASYVTMRLNMMDLHMTLGTVLLALLLFRWIWGFVGSETARFGHFLGSPLRALRFLARIGVREPDTQIGHSPAGGWMTLLLLLLLSVQVAAGLCANDGAATEGPLAKYVGGHASDVLSYVHAVTFKLILAAVALHLLAIATYAVVKKQNLVRPMVTGKKRLPGATRAPRMASPLLALGVLAIAGAIAAVVGTR